MNVMNPATLSGLSTALSTLTVLSTLLLAPLAQAQQSAVFLFDRDGNPGQLTDLESNFILSRFETLNLSNCKQSVLSSRPRLDYRRMEVPYGEQTLKLHVSPDVMRTGTMVLYTESPDGIIEYTNCETETAYLLPVMALIVTANFEDTAKTSLIRQRVLAQNSYLSSYEPNRLMARSDSDDADNIYMDFTLSSKHPILPNAATINAAYNTVTETMERLIPGDDEYFMQFYLGFTGRFSQYIGSRDSAPVVSRRFNPELFYRFWSSDTAFLDIGLGHESNGQRINSEESFLREGDAFEANGEPRIFARDGLSRGWDYTSVKWQRAWNANLITQLKLRHYLSNGLMQGEMEEYNTWEDGGTRLRPRRQYDGVSLDIQYNFNESRCLLGDLPICFRKLQLTQQTGYSAMFDNNSTTLELTTDFFGLPIQFWSRTGYNNNLVNYYNDSTSWGLGIELISR